MSYDDRPPETASGSSSASSRSAPLARTFTIAFAVTALAVYGASAISPVLPDIAAAFNVDAARASLLVSLFILPMAVLTPLIGLAAHRLSLRPVLIVCLLIYGVAGLACAEAPTFSTLLALRILQGCGGAALELFGLVILIESAAPSQLHSAIGRNAGVIGLSTAVAPLVSGALAFIGWRATFLSAALAFPLALAVKLYLPALPGKSPGKVGASHLSLGVFLRKPIVVSCLVSTLVVFLFLFGVLLSFVPEKAQRIGIHSDFLIALVPTGCAVAIGVTAPFMGKLMKYLGMRGVVTLAYVLYALSMGAFHVGSDLLVLVFGGVLLGAAHGLLFPLIQALLAKEAPPEGSVIFMSFNIAAIGIGQTLTPLLTSAIFESAGLGAVFVVTLAVALVMIPVSWMVLRAEEGRLANIS
jgi:MFS transporter, ACDE family, multidrug resistance protein